MEAIYTAARMKDSGKHEESGDSSQTKRSRESANWPEYMDPGMIQKNHPFVLGTAKAGRICWHSKIG